MKRKAILGLVAVCIVAVVISSLFVQSKFSSFENQIAEQKSKNNVLEKQNGGLQNQTDSLTKENEVLRGQISELTEQLASERTLRVKVISLSTDKNWIAYGGLLVKYPFRVTLKNNDAVTVDGLVVTVTAYEGNKAFGSHSLEIGLLHAGEERTLQGGIVVSLGTPPGLTYKATITAGDTVVYEYMQP